jgi:transposase InsO family protein
VEAGGTRAKKSTFKTITRTAEEPGQAVNVDLCFVPASHEAEDKLPAVSGSSGHLVIERPKDEEAAAQYPGRIFEDQSRSYTEAMRAFVTASGQASPPEQAPANGETLSRKTKIRRLRQEEVQLRHDRRGIRARRSQEDRAWQAIRQQHRPAEADFQMLRKPERRRQRHTRQAETERWKAHRDQRRQTLAQRDQEDEHWRQQRLDLRERMKLAPIITAWIAILVITDNCTRQCLGLPLFVAGSAVTAEMIVAALRTLLPPELQFLISDRGVHFTAQVFQQLARNEQFIHVVIARHRPQSNGIAERFVRTLKEWLATHAWENDQELLALLEQFRPEFNDRPHQGIGIPGLSPNEFANRIWLM